MRVLVHDFCGHPFQVQLSRELARRGHDVLHLYCDSVVSARGAVEADPADPPSFQVRPVHLQRPFSKYRPLRRGLQEIRYGRQVASLATSYAPDVVLSSNTPLISQRQLLGACRATATRFVFWQQDVLGVGIRNEMGGRFGPLGGAIGRRFEELEGDLLRASDAVVTISEDFLPKLEEAGLDPGSVHVVRNWAPLEEIPLRPRRNRWAESHGLADNTVFLYAGTLGLKHTPHLLLRLAEKVAIQHGLVVVIAEGPGAEWLRENAGAVGNLVLLPYQPYESLPDVLATGDVLISLLQRDAGAFSVPSKTLSYMCAGRPILAAVPPGNLAARLIHEAGAGLTVDPSDEAGFAAAAGRLASEPQFGTQGRAYAERTFHIGSIAARFEEILGPGRPPTDTNLAIAITEGGSSG